MPIFEGCISPVFDVAKNLMLVDVENRQEIARAHVVLEDSNPDLKTRRVIDLGASTLICGAISKPLESCLLSAGVEVIPQTCGGVEDVLHAFVAGALDENIFVAPGCQKHRRSCDHGIPKQGLHERDAVSPGGCGLSAKASKPPAGAIGSSL